MVRDRDASARHQAALRRSGAARRRLLPRLRRADARRPPLQHADPRRARRPHRRSLPQGAPARATTSTSRGGRSSTSRSATSKPAPRASRCGGRSAASSAWLICNDRRWPEAYRVLGLQGVELVLHRLQHAGPQPACARPRPARRLPQPPRDAVGRVPERHLGGRGRQGGRRGGRADDRRLGDHRSRRARSPRSARRSATRSWSRAATSLCATATSRPCSTSSVTARSSTTAASPASAAPSRHPAKNRGAGAHRDPIPPRSRLGPGAQHHLGGLDHRRVSPPRSSSASTLTPSSPRGRASPIEGRDSSTSALRPTAPPPRSSSPTPA